MAKDFQQDALVWAKMKGFSPWPARIDVPADGKVPKSKKLQHYVSFFGTHNFAWILDQHIFPHSEEMLANAKRHKKLSSNMQSAIQEIEEASQEIVGTKSRAKQDTDNESESDPPPPPSEPDTVSETTPKSSKKRTRVERKPAKKRLTPSMSRNLDTKETVASEKAVDSDDDFSLLIASVSSKSPPKKRSVPSTLRDLDNGEMVEVERTVESAKNRSTRSTPRDINNKETVAVRTAVDSIKKISLSTSRDLENITKVAVRKAVDSFEKKSGHSTSRDIDCEKAVNSAKKRPAPSTLSDHDYEKTFKVGKTVYSAKKKSAPSTSRDHDYEETIKVGKAVDSDDDDSLLRADVSLKKPSKKRFGPSTSRDLDNEETVETEKAVDSDDDYSLLIANVPPNNGYPNVAVIPPYSDDSDICPPTTKKIGFLGLGEIGYDLVKMLLSTGHDVRVWNRTILSIHNELIKAGAKKARNPADLIHQCDITFSCVSDDEASKAVVFLKNGVLEGFDNKLCHNKAYVELSSIHPLISEEIGEAITGKGGRYLEASMSGNRQDVSKSSLVILASGNRELFEECSTVFAAWAKKAIYVSCEVGAGNKLHKCLHMLAGTSYEVLSECLAVIKHIKINSGVFMELVAKGPANFQLLLEKGQAMITNDSTVYTPIKHQQKDLVTALDLGTIENQPLGLAASASEVYKRALKHDKESDVSIIGKCLK